MALLEPGADHANLAGLDLERLEVDLRRPRRRRPGREGLPGHLPRGRPLPLLGPRPPAVLRRQRGRDPQRHGRGPARRDRAVVYTSTVGTLGLDGGHDGRPSDEASYADVSHLFGSYKQSKYVAEHEVLRAAAEGLPVSIVLPTFPLGPGDRAPTPTGRLVLDYLNGRVPGYVDTVLNVAHVDDVAAGQILALERGAIGRSYILGGENYSLEAPRSSILAASPVCPEAELRVPRALSLGVAHLSEFVEGRLLRRHPSVPLEAARMSTTRMAFDDSRARQELGYAPRPAEQAVLDSARWFVENGYVKTPDRVSRHFRPVPTAAPAASDDPGHAGSWAFHHPGR